MSSWFVDCLGVWVGLELELESRSWLPAWVDRGAKRAARASISVSDAALIVSLRHATISVANEESSRVCTIERVGLEAALYKEG